MNGHDPLGAVSDYAFHASLLDKAKPCAGSKIGLSEKRRHPGRISGARWSGHGGGDAGIRTRGAPL